MLLFGPIYGLPACVMSRHIGIAVWLIGVLLLHLSIYALLCRSKSSFQWLALQPSGGARTHAHTWSYAVPNEGAAQPKNACCESEARDRADPEGQGLTRALK